MTTQALIIADLHRSTHILPIAEHRANRQPDRRWMRAWYAAYRACGGWCGPATLTVQERLAVGYYKAGASTKVAGAACAACNRLWQALDLEVDWAGAKTEAA